MKRVDVELSKIWRRTTEALDRGPIQKAQNRLSAVGIDLGAYAAKVHLQVGGRAYRDEIPSRGRSDEEVLSAVIEQVAATPEAWSQVEILALASPLDDAATDLQCSRLAEAWPHLRLEAAPPIDPRLAPWFAAREHQAGPLWVLDIGWQESRLFELVADGGDPRVASSRSERQIHGRLVDRGVLHTLEEFGVAGDVDKIYGDIESQEYAHAEGLKHQLAEKKVIKARDGTSIKAGIFERDLFRQTEWKNFAMLLADEVVRESMTEGGGLLLCGGSCRLPWLASRLEQGFSALRPLAIPGEDPGFVRALGWTLYALDHALLSWEPEAAEESPVEDTEPPATGAATGTEAPPPTQVLSDAPAPERKMPEEHSPRAASGGTESPEAARPAAASEFSPTDVGRLHLRLEGDLVPMFEGPVHCAALPPFLAREGRARIDLQCYLPAVQSGGCPRFVGRRTLEVPPGEGFSLRFHRLEPVTSRLRVEVWTGGLDPEKEEIWDVAEE